MKPDKHKSYFISGGTGSFGNTVVRRLLADDVGEVRIFSRDEKKQDDMRQTLNDPRVSFYIGDVRDYRSVRDAMDGVDYVFHAAALKQVPSCEDYPMEAVRTNVLGTDNVLHAAVEAGVKKVICLSTDKSCLPLNAMGVSKAMMEKVAAAKARQTDPKRTLICCTRYGNVMASRGSVIPLFIQQIKAGLPLTVTDGAMTRFLMNLDEAVGLVLFALENAQQGDLFIQKSPACTMADLAQAIINLFNPAAEIKMVGVRPGEKAHETLLTREERAKSEDLDQYFRVPSSTHGSVLGEAYTSANTTRLTIPEVEAKLMGVGYVQEALKGATK